MGDAAPKLVVCGTGPMEEWCNDFVQQNQVNIELKGFVPNIMTRKLIANSKALVLSTQWYEGFPMSIVESFSVGTPVICPDIGNVGSIVKEGITGAKFAANSPDELIRAVNRLQGYENIDRSTYEIYERLYSEKQNYEHLMKIYQNVQIL